MALFAPSSWIVLCVAGLAGCLSDAGDSGAPSDSKVAPGGRWSDIVSIRMNESGAVLIPFFAPEAATVQAGRMWLDGGSWRGYHFNLIDEQVAGMERWGGGYEREERAGRVYENTRDGVYQIECLGEPEGAFCAQFSNPDLEEEPLVGDDYSFRNGHTLPQGFHYFVVHAAFETYFQVNLTMDRSLWLGDPIPAHSAVNYGPEYFRGDYLDMVRCGRITWCGAMIDAILPISGDGEFALIELQTTAIGAAYADGCIVLDNGERRCDMEPAQVGPSLVWNLREVIPMALHPTITATMAGGPPLKGWTQNIAGSWWLGGKYVTFSLPEAHPARTADSAQAP